MGSYDGKELCLDILSGELAAPDDIKYKFEFRDPTLIRFPWIKFKDMVFSGTTSLRAYHKIKFTFRAV